jgi:hypothetical protein
MSYEAERLEILKLVEAGKVSPEEGMRLLQALGSRAKHGAERAVTAQTGAFTPSPPITPVVTPPPPPDTAAATTIDTTHPAGGPMDAAVEQGVSSAAIAAATGRWFRLLVEEPGGQRVNITVPLQAVPVALRFAARWVPDEYRDALDGVAEIIRSDFRGEILSVNEPGGERVRIWIEGDENPRRPAPSEGRDGDTLSQGGAQ